MSLAEDQAAQDRFSADLLCVDVGHGGAGSVMFAVGDALRDALVGPGRVVVHLVLGQDGAQMSRIIPSAPSMAAGRQQGLCFRIRMLRTVPLSIAQCHGSCHCA